MKKYKQDNLTIHNADCMEVMSKYENFKYKNFAAGTSATSPLIKAHPKIGRNDPCLCNSKLKYKNCCLRHSSYIVDK